MWVSLLSSFFSLAYSFKFEWLYCKLLSVRVPMPYLNSNKRSGMTPEIHVCILSTFLIKSGSGSLEIDVDSSNDLRNIRKITKLCVLVKCVNKLVLHALAHFTGRGGGVEDKNLD